MLIKSSAIDRLLRENPELGERRFGLPSIGLRNDGEKFNLQCKVLQMQLIFMVMRLEMKISQLFLI